MSDMPDNLPEEDSARAAEYALGLLDASEAAAFEADMAANPDLRAAYAAWAEHFVRLTDGIAPVAPPSRLLASLLAAIAPVPSKQRGGWLGFWRGAGLGLGVVAAVLLVVWVGLFPIGPRGPVLPSYGTELVNSGNGIAITATFDGATGAMDLVMANAPAPQGRTYELWLLPAGEPPVSLGVLADTQTARIALDETLVPALERGMLAVSLEPAGGAPRGLPTGPILVTAPLTQI